MNFINQLLENFEKETVYLSFKDTIWGVDLADMQLISKYNKGIRYLFCAIDRFSKYEMIVPLRDKKGVTIANAFQNILDSSRRKPNEISVDQGSEFYNKCFEKWLEDKDTKVYSTYNEGKSVVAERYVRTLKNKIFKHITAVSKNVYFYVLDDIADNYNNIYHRTIKMKPVDVKPDSYVDVNVVVNMMLIPIE